MENKNDIKINLINIISKHIELANHVDIADAADEIIKELIKEDGSFENAVEPLMKWMGKNSHPHTTTIVTVDRAELVEGLRCHLSDKYILD